MATNEPEGVDGELVDRLLEAMNSSDGRHWADLGWFLVYAVGGKELETIVPDTGAEPIPGTLGAEIRKTHEVVGREDYFRRVRTRLMRLVNSGMREDFLVRALRDDLTSHLQLLAQTEVGDTRRESLREDLERDASDPERIAKFRAALARHDPTALQMDDEEIASHLREMAESLGPTSHEDAQERWNRVIQWGEQAAVISDDVIAKWGDRYSRRVTRNF